MNYRWQFGRVKMADEIRILPTTVVIICCFPHSSSRSDLCSLIFLATLFKNMFEVNLSDICDFTEGKRPLIEGEKVFNANHIMLCGITEKTNIYRKIFCLCLKSSSLFDYPHEISLTVYRDKFEGTCSCKAGAGSKCKHLIATLLYLNR